MFICETRGRPQKIGVNWVQIGQRQSRDDAVALCDYLAKELDRYVRVVRYRPSFETIYSNTHPRER